MDAAIAVANKKGYKEMRREDIVMEANVSEGLVLRCFNPMIQMRKAVMRYAIKNKHYQVIVQGIAVNDPVAKRIPPSLKLEALESVK